ncbi:MAG: fluoride efflux transporter CrcB [Bacteroidia bacterium]
MSEWIAVFIGGGIGSISRYGISRWLGTTEGGFPVGTLTANILSCIVLGLAWGYFSRYTEVSSSVKLLLMVGFCGGFSTFSTFSLETMKMFQLGQYMMAAGYICLSILMCVLILVFTTRLFAQG